MKSFKKFFIFSLSAVLTISTIYGSLSYGAPQVNNSKSQKKSAINHNQSSVSRAEKVKVDSEITHTFGYIPPAYWSGNCWVNKSVWTEFYNFAPFVCKPVLCAFVAGNFALQLENQSDQQVINSAMCVLHKIYGLDIPNPCSYIVTRWGKNPYSEGSFSSLSPGALDDGEDYLNMAKTINNHLLFAGEATTDTYPSTVYGAYMSGDRVAQEILSHASASKHDTGSHQYKVIIIGAGMAGLEAANYLQAHGLKDFIILEACDHIGGRAYTINWNNVDISLGATWIHGVSPKNPISQLASKWNICTKPFNYDGDVYDLAGYELPDCATKRNTALYECFKDLLKEKRKDPVKNAHLSVSDVAAEFIQTHCLDKNSQAGLMYEITDNIEENYGADITKLSAIWYDNDEAFSENDSILVHGYAEIINVIARCIRDRILLNHVVNKVDYQNNQRIIVSTTNGKQFSADYVISTLPIGVLKKGSVKFIPQLPADKLAAIQRINMGTMDKIIMYFPKVFWERNTDYEAYERKSNNIILYGYIDGSYNNLLHSNRFTSGIYNRLTDSNENGVSLQQLSLIASRLPEHDGFGFLVNPMIGRDAYSFQTYGMGPINVINYNVGIILNRAFVEYMQGPWTFMLGKYDAIGGIESNYLPENHNFSYSMLGSYIEPGLVVGARGIYKFCHDLKFIFGVTNGLDSARDWNIGKTLELGIKQNLWNMFEFDLSTYIGQQRASVGTDTGPRGTQYYYNLGATWHVNPCLDLVIDYDYIYKNRTALPFENVIGVDDEGEDITDEGPFLGPAFTQGVTGYINYKWNDCWQTSLRGEYLNDPRGFATDLRQSIKEVTFSVTYFPIKNLFIRAETRHDISNNNHAYARINSFSSSNNQQSYALQVDYSFG